MVSSAAAAPAVAPRRYFYHQCDRTVTLTPSSASDIVCPICQGGFLEEFDLPPHKPNPNPSLAAFHSFHASPALAPTSSSPRPPTDSTFQPSSARTPSAPPPKSAAADGEPFDPLLFFPIYMQNRSSDHDAIRVSEVSKVIDISRLWRRLEDVAAAIGGCRRSLGMVPSRRCMNARKSLSTLDL